jgi:hypothetical protein
VGKQKDACPPYKTDMKQSPINIVTAERISDYRIHLAFDDGTEQTVDFKLFLTHAQHPDIRAYLDPAKFSAFRIEYGELIWRDYELCFPIMDLYRNCLDHTIYQDVAD